MGSSMKPSGGEETLLWRNIGFLFFVFVGFGTAKLETENAIFRWNYIFTK